MRKVVFFTLALAATLAGCLPPSDPYPSQPPSVTIAQAQQISDSLEAYIYRWVQNNASDSIPDALIPQGISDSKDFYLKDPDSVTAAETWAVRYAKPIDKDSLYAGIPDPKVTYLFLGTALAPFGSKLVIEGEFPHCRFFSIQTTPPLNGTEYYSQRQFGTAEVGFADVDIDPLPGHTNPFRVGANRNATQRSYHVEFNLATGDPTTLNGAAHTYPYRENTNVRTGAMLVYQGPLGHKTIAGTPLPANQQGDWNLGAVWIRIYEPDDNVNPLGGVPMPKAWFELPTGERYFVGSDFTALQRRADTTIANRVTAPGNAGGTNFATGWFKSWGITRSILNGVSISANFSRQDSAQRIREIDLGWTGRGEFQPAPGNIEPHATTNNYATYIGRSVSVPPGKVLVLTGRLPTFPATRNGEATMTAGEVRYWSIIGIDQDPFSPMPATTINAITDDDVVIDNNRNYVIAYSRSTERPVNATASNGVTWVDYGTQSDIGILMRWVNIAPEWTFAFDPHEHQLDFSHSDWAGTLYDSSLLGINWRHGFMQCYLPQVHLMSVAEFQNLGGGLNAESIPVWVDSTYRNGPAESRLGTLTASSVLDTNAANQVWNANDGDLNTGWASGFAQPNATITCDLGAVKNISAVKLFWDWIFFGSDYQVQVSQDNINWTTIATAVNENGQLDLYRNFSGIQARYVRLNLTQYNTGWYRLMEFEVYVTDCDCQAPPLSSGPVAVEPTAGVRIFPNPAANELHYTLEGWPEQPRTIQVFALNGSLVLSTTIYSPTGTLPLETLSPGVYLLQISDGVRRKTLRFVKS
ncbi:MAG: discoidin domain-containing protein [Bacteroidia bacterium]|jgi:hypothetical protein|nr:discoidin domain-containing protein [Bacteroidia bacterium]